jgi:hypothetical protein
LTDEQKDQYSDAFKLALQQRESQLQSVWARTVYQP